jgi:hypothetical protein
VRGSKLRSWKSGITGNDKVWGIIMSLKWGEGWRARSAAEKDQGIEVVTRVLYRSASLWKLQSPRTKLGPMLERGGK